MVDKEFSGGEGCYICWCFVYCIFWIFENVKCEVFWYNLIDCIVVKFNVFYLNKFWIGLVKLGMILFKELKLIMEYGLMW